MIFAIASIGAVVYSYAIYPFVLAAVAALKQVLADAHYVLGKKDRRGGEAELPDANVISSGDDLE